jgi:PAS domain S-box-containing protein
MRNAELYARVQKTGQQLDNLIRNAADGIITIDEEGIVESVNQAAEQIFGYASEEVINQNVSMLMPPPFSENHDKYLLRYLKTGHPKVIGKAQEVSGRRKDGTIFPMHLSVGEFVIGDKRMYTGILRDMTARKRKEEELVLAKEEAEKANQAKSDFLATMSHEIRTPMNGIIGMTGLLLDSPLTDEQRGYAVTVRNSGDALLTVINDILDFSKIEAGKLELEIIDFDLGKTLDDVTELFANNAQSKGLWVVSLVSPDIPPVLRGDPGRLRQIFLNLIGNAIKFTEKGGITLRAAVESERDRSVLVRFEVSDTGVGIPQKARPHLFQAFSQADKSTTRKYGGTGLGLAICENLTKLMGGEMGFESELGGGSTFWFTATFEKLPSDALSLSTPRKDLHGLRVLLVDDEEAIREMLHEQLASWGITSEQAQNGRQALAMLQDCSQKGMPYDLAILDLTMPDMDGLELARTVKADPTIASVRLVMLTGYGQRGEGMEARKAGLSAYLVKPVTHSQLSDCISRVMSSPEDTPLITRHSLQELRISERAQFRILIAEDNDVNQKVAKRMLERFGYRADLAGNGGPRHPGIPRKMPGGRDG